MLVLLLPETNRRRLFETVEEHVTEERSKRRMRRKIVYDSPTFSC